MIDPANLMSRAQAIQLLEEALDRLRQPQLNSSGGAWQAGGCYWRLMRVLADYVAPLLYEVEGITNAERLRASHGVPAPVSMQPDSIEKTSPDRLLRLPEVESKVGLRKSCIYDAVKRGAFPEPIQLSRRAVVWQASAIDIWIADRIRGVPWQHGAAAKKKEAAGS